MSDEPAIVLRRGRNAAIMLSPWLAAVAITGVATLVRNNDLEKLSAVDQAGQRRAEANAARITVLEANAEREAREDIARDQRALRVELSVAGSVDVVAELRSTVKELTSSIQRLNLELASMRAARGVP